MENANPFAAAERRYRDLEARYRRGELDEATFQQARMECLVRDEYGRSWLPAPEPGRWYLWDGQQWTPYDDAPSPPPIGAVTYRSAAPPRERATQRPGCRGCLLVGLILLLAIGAYGVWRSPLPERWGLRQSAAERLLGEPDRQIADEIALELSSEGQSSTDGVYFYVLPIEGGQGRILYTIADASEGFEGIKAMAGSPDALVAYLVSLAESEAVKRAGISRLALDYRDETGAEFGVLTARTEDVLAFSRGAMSREAFMEVLDGRVNLEMLAEEVLP